MLYNGRQQVIKFSGISKENLTLTVLYIFLNVQSNRLRYTEIFHGFGDCYAQFRTKMKKVIDCMTRSENNGGMIQYGNLLLSELFC